MSIYNLVSLGGFIVFILVAWLFSTNRKFMNWKLVGWGVGLQILFAAFIFWVPQGTQAFLFLNKVVIKILDSASAGTAFAFGRLALAPGQTNVAGEESLGFILAFQALPTIIFFSALVSLLYFFNIMPWLIRMFASVFTRLMKLSGAESLVAASNIFVGIESILTVKPYLSKMTRSEFCTVLTVGMASVASNVLVLYVFSLRDVFPNIVGHLISASLLSAPAALVMSKVLLPEEFLPETMGTSVKPHVEKENSFFEAIIYGAQAGVKMIVGILAVLIAVLGLVALTDVFLSFINTRVIQSMGLQIDLSLKSIAGYFFYPLTLLLGIPLQDVSYISQIIGERLIVTEVVAYQDLSQLLRGETALISTRSAVIATYALCGFAHLASMAIFVGGVVAIVPERTEIVAKVALRALFAATLACLMTACVAGMFFRENSILFGE